jgi:predicted Rossmann fold flavoprotein
MNKFDVIIIGASAAGLMCAIEAGKRNRTVIVIDHANKPGKKILMSGGGRCNFTNIHASHENYISHNPHFCKSALSRYTPQNFLELVRRYQIAYHEKTRGQLFCDNKSKDILDMLLQECNNYHVTIAMSTTVEKIVKQDDNAFWVTTSKGQYPCQSLVIATGGLSIPTLGASGFGYQVAEQFGIKVWPTRAGLVPFTLQPEDKAITQELSGVSLEVVVESSVTSFHEDMLFTHRGLSGPAMLQISSYWQPGEYITVNMLPRQDLATLLKAAQLSQPSRLIKNVLIEYFPKRIVPYFINPKYLELALGSASHKILENIAHSFCQWQVKPGGTEGYRTAEVTLGGVACEKLSSKTMEVETVKGLYFIGEVVDVTGWLGGYNFQWAWSSGWAAGQVV